jgi:hypothetical protein
MLQLLDGNAMDLGDISYVFLELLHSCVGEILAHYECDQINEHEYQHDVVDDGIENEGSQWSCSERQNLGEKFK